MTSLRDPGPVRPADAYLPQRRAFILAGRCVTCPAKDLQDENFRDDRQSSSELIADQVARQRERAAAAPARALTPGEVRQRDESFVVDLEKPGGPA